MLQQYIVGKEEQTHTQTLEKELVRTQFRVVPKVHEH